MANQLLLVNPAKRRTRRKTRRKTNTAARRPTRRRSRTTGRTTAAARITARRRRNPISRKVTVNSVVNDRLMPAFTAGAGALSLDIIMGYLPLPPAMSTGPVKYLVKGLGAIGLGMAAAMVVKPKTAHELSQGALTVVAHDALREMTQRFAPNVALNAYGSDVMGYYNAGYPMNGMGFYQGGSDLPTVGDNINAPGLAPPCAPCPTPSVDGMGYYGAHHEDMY